MIQSLGADHTEAVYASLGELILPEAGPSVTLQFYLVSAILHMYGPLSFGLWDDDRIGGICLNFPLLSRNGAFLFLFGIRPDLRRKGFGTLLFEESAHLLKADGYQVISLRVLRENKTALRFWQKMGFIEKDAPGLEATGEFAEAYMELGL